MGVFVWGIFIAPKSEPEFIYAYYRLNGLSAPTPPLRPAQSALCVRVNCFPLYYSWLCECELWATQIPPIYIYIVLLNN